MSVGISQEEELSHFALGLGVYNVHLDLEFSISLAFKLSLLCTMLLCLL